ncbi:hypothetical protein BpHYR1_019992 [Brachionus plicatilis]|uniref:Uncharacterized protein n=1 Tax=Brachionus plicatilis TaxID=10195 RepID=A0A3M7P6Z7_BRAPC|nr:hypothetical protein BpHYR1_019992 [Brachionus plicatilis]
MATEIGPMLAIASVKAFSSPCGISTYPVSVAPTADGSNLHFPSLAVYGYESSVSIPLLALMYSKA